MNKFKTIVFDIDGTLTRSKLPIDGEIADLLRQLLEEHKVAIISGAGYEQFKWQILDHLKCKSEKIKNLFLLPVDGTIFCHYEDGWLCQSDEPFSTKDKERIRESFKNIFAESGLDQPEKIYGELLEDRGAQFNFSALGQDAPIDLKEKWDPDNEKRKRIVEVLRRSLSDFAMRIGGTTSVEITTAGVDKAYGLNKFIKITGVLKEEILYIGDKFFEGGNDAPVLALGIEYNEVKSPEETKKVIMTLLE